jgi:hypothetical protein
MQGAYYKWNWSVIVSDIVQEGRCFEGYSLKIQTVHGRRLLLSLLHATVRAENVLHARLTMQN